MTGKHVAPLSVSAAIDERIGTKWGAGPRHRACVSDAAHASPSDVSATGVIDERNPETGGYESREYLDLKLVDPGAAAKIPAPYGSTEPFPKSVDGGYEAPEFLALRNQGRYCIMCVCQAHREHDLGFRVVADVSQSVHRAAAAVDGGGDSVGSRLGIADVGAAHFDSSSVVDSEAVTSDVPLTTVGAAADTSRHSSRDVSAGSDSPVGNLHDRRDALRDPAVDELPAPAFAPVAASRHINARG